MSNSGNDDSELTVVSNASSDVACTSTTFKWKGGTPPYSMSLENEQISIDFPNTNATNFTANVVFAPGSNVTATLFDSGGFLIRNELDFPVFQVKDGGNRNCELVYIHQDNTHLPPDASEDNPPAFDATNSIDFHNLVPCQTFSILWQGGGEPILLGLQTVDNSTVLNFDGLRGKNFTTSLPFPTGTDFIIQLFDTPNPPVVAGPFTVQPGGTTDCLPAPLPDPNKASGANPSSSSSFIASSTISQAPPSATSASQQQSTGISGGAIGGIVAGVTLLVCLGIIAMMLMRQRRRRRRYLETDLFQPDSINPFTHNDQIMWQVEPFGAPGQSSPDHPSNLHGNSSSRLLGALSKGRRQASDQIVIEPVPSSVVPSSRSPSEGKTDEQGPLYHRDAGPVREEIPPSYADVQHNG